MNFKKSWKRANDGFTLVELIVVIAILAILAGIAVPAYSGYIKKANKAADLQLLGAVNTAFAAAAMDADNISISSQPDGSYSFNISTMKPSAYQEEFALYFGGNTATFQVITGLQFKGGAFVEVEGGRVSATYNGVTLYFDQNSIDAVNGSTFMTAEGLGVEGLMGKLNLTTGFASALLTEDGEVQSDALNAVVSDIAFQRTLAGYLGIDANDMDSDQINTAIGEWIEANPDADLGAMSSNALVLYAAQNSTMSTQDATALLTGNTKTEILNTLRGTETTEANTTAAMAQAALAYGMYTSYAYSTGDETLIANASSTNPLDVMSMLEDPDFKDYIAGEQGQKDLEGYLSAMQMIDSAAGNSDVAGDILANGFSNDDLSKLLGDVLK